MRKVVPRYLVGVEEIAVRAGVNHSAVCNWQVRYPHFPQPVVRLSCGPIYYWPDVSQWLRQTGRKIVTKSRKEGR